MKTYKLKFILLTFGVVFFTSCTKLFYTSLDVLRPAQVAFSLNSNNLAIINNTVVQPSNFGHKTQLLNEKKTNANVQTDSLAILCLNALNEDLETKDFFASVNLISNSVNKSSYFNNTSELTDENVKKLCNANRSSVLLSLDKIQVNDDLNEYFIPENMSFLATLEARVETTWSIHYPGVTDFETIQFKDTLYWESNTYNRKEAIKELPDRVDALKDAALEAGHKSVNRFVPYWEKVDRYFYSSNNKLMKQAMDSVYVKNWKSAIEIWEKVYNTKQGSIQQAQAANNIAIAYEITGDVENAIEYATKSYYMFGKLTFPDYNSFARIYDYVNELNKRKKEITILKKQIGD